MEDILELRSGQLEQRLSQRIETLYRTQLGLQPSQVTCNLLDNKIAIFVENSITQPEQLLSDIGNQKLAEQLRSKINQEMKSSLKDLIEEVFQIPVIDVLIDSAIATGRTSTIVVLATTPEVQAPSITSEIKQKMGFDGDGGEP
jgi:uncharacterized protein YbcI